MEKIKGWFWSAARIKWKVETALSHCGKIPGCLLYYYKSTASVCLFVCLPVCHAPFSAATERIELKLLL